MTAVEYVCAHEVPLRSPFPALRREMKENPHRFFELMRSGLAIGDPPKHRRCKSKANYSAWGQPYMRWCWRHAPEEADRNLKIGLEPEKPVFSKDAIFVW